MTLKDLRRSLGVTQIELAKELHVAQKQISGIEGRADLLVSTLRKYIEALGGELEIRAKFSNRRLIVIDTIGKDPPS